ncbi:hypothetical protein DPEC_G00361390 [Dallia pectoralis]|uniref:Uncharacterized protein n=1 Tax=Dallia pectoralis TaxID=75939 RepID=A0ACC2F136_DALPE|nr:hypothetical protein DPEC_G00361390 [Dallia pectoralis]
MFNCCSHGTLLHFGLQSSRLNICYYHQDLHPRRLHPGPRPRLPCSPRRPSYSSRRSPRGSRGRRRPGMGPTLQRHPFSGLVDSAGIVHHLSGTIACAHAPPPRQSGRDGPVVRPAPGGRDPTSAGARRPSLSLRLGFTRAGPYPAARRGRTRTGDSPDRSTVAPGSGPRAPPRGSMTQRALCPRPRETASRGRGAVKLTAARPVATFAPPFQADPETVAAHRRRKKCARRRNLNPGADPRLGIRTHRALDGVYHPLWAAFPNNPTLRRLNPARQGPLLASHHPRAGPRSEGLRPQIDAGRSGLLYATFPASAGRTGIRRWALPSSLAATEGILEPRRGNAGSGVLPPAAAPHGGVLLGPRLSEGRSTINRITSASGRVIAGWGRRGSPRVSPVPGADRRLGGELRSPRPIRPATSRRCGAAAGGKTPLPAFPRRGSYGGNGGALRRPENFQAARARGPATARKLLTTTSDQTRQPAEFKHITKRRKRN